MEKWGDPTCNPPRLLNADKEASRETRLLERALVTVKYIYIYMCVFERKLSTKERVNQTRARPVDRRTHLAGTSQRSRSPASGQKLYTLDLSYLSRPIIKLVSRILMANLFQTSHCCDSCTQDFFYRRNDEEMILKQIIQTV